MSSGAGSASDVSQSGALGELDDLADAAGGQAEHLVRGSETEPHLVVMEDFFHVRPPLARLAGFERFMAGLADGPPFLRARVGRHQCHVGIEVISDILEVGKQKAVLVVDLVVANPAFGYLCEDLGPSGRV